MLIREHTTMTDLLSYLWLNEVNVFTPRDQISFGYVVRRLRDALKFFMFSNCEYIRCSSCTDTQENTHLKSNGPKQ